jgi:hypothetical protein
MELSNGTTIELVAPPLVIDLRIHHALTLYLFNGDKTVTDTGLTPVTDIGEFMASFSTLPRTNSYRTPLPKN